MSDSNSNVAGRGGVSFMGLLLLLFVGLKLTGYIDWSWFWVLSPVWIPLVAVMSLLVVLVVFGLVSKWLTTRSGKPQ